MDFLKEMATGGWDFLEGKKTYLVCLAGFVLWIGFVFDWWTMDEIQELLVLLGSLGVYSLRSAIKKVE